jgi:hypothetical protein
VSPPGWDRAIEAVAKVPPLHNASLLRVVMVCADTVKTARAVGKVLLGNSNHAGACVGCDEGLYRVHYHCLPVFLLHRSRRRIGSLLLSRRMIR